MSILSGLCQDSGYEQVMQMWREEKRNGLKHFKTGRNPTNVVDWLSAF